MTNIYAIQALPWRVKEVGEVRWIILWQEDWLERGEIRQQQPIPGTKKNV